AEVEALATHGPGAVYAWIFGPNSLMAKKIASATWADMNITDPVLGCRQLVEGIRKFQDSSSKKPEPVDALLQGVSGSDEATATTGSGFFEEESWNLRMHSTSCRQPRTV